SNRFGTLTTQSSTVTRAILGSFARLRNVTNIWTVSRRGNSSAAQNRHLHAARGRALTPLAARPYITAAAGRLTSAGWQSGYATDCKSVHPGSIPGPASKQTLENSGKSGLPAAFSLSSRLLNNI